MNPQRHSGVYLLVNKKNKKVYVGSTSTRFYVRWNNHKKSLRQNKHHSRHLQKAWNKYGEDIFSFEIVETLKQKPSEKKTKFKTRLIKAEQYWMNYYKSYNRKNGYNITKIAGSSFGTVFSYKAKLNLSKSKGGKPFGAYKGIKLVGKFDIQSDCAEKLNINRTLISRCLTGSLKKSKGYTFKYLEKK